MSESSDQLRTQYQTDRNLNARIALHADYSTNTYGWHRWVFDRIELPSSARVLELGCGPASLWTGNRQRVGSGWRPLLTDSSRGMVTTAMDHLAEVQAPFSFAVADAMVIPCRHQAVDSVIANHMLYHVPDREQVLYEAHRVLKPGGCIYATTVGASHMWELWDLLEPFVPDIHARTNQVAEGFTLENGGEQLAQFFGEVTRHDYPDDLKVTEVQPIIDYIRSSNTMVGCDLTPNEWAAVRRKIVAHLDLKGHFYIRKASGMFIARA